MRELRGGRLDVCGYPADAHHRAPQLSALWIQPMDAMDEMSHPLLQPPGTAREWRCEVRNARDKTATKARPRHFHDSHDDTTERSDSGVIKKLLKMYAPNVYEPDD